MDFDPRTEWRPEDWQATEKALRRAIKGIRPTKVVSEVRKIGLNLLGPASRTASFMLFPSDLYRLIKSTITKLSFTTTPVSATIPIIESTERLRPKKRWPNTAPVIPKGIEDITTSG